MAQKSSSHEKSKAVSTKDGIQVHCKFDVLKPASELKLYPGNYRKHKAKQLDAMQKVINGNGWRRCAVVSSLSGCVIKGNGMVQMAQRHGYEVPVEYQTYNTRREEIRDLVADNRLAELAEDDKDLLKKLVSELDAGEIDLAGVTEDDLKEVIGKLEKQDEEKPKEGKVVEIDAMYQVIVECRNEEHQKEVLTKLEAEGQKCRLLTL